MSIIHVVGGKKLEGSVTVQGSKNAALPILAAVLLTKGIQVFENCPQISDVEEMLEILRELGCIVWNETDKLYICTPERIQGKIDKKHIISMRSSIILLGVLLGENGQVCIEYPGGCTIGERPIDLHIKGLQKLGCKFESNKQFLCATVEKMQGANIYLEFPSVGATENLILAAVKAQGETKIYGAAKEPEIVHLCNFLIKCGANIKGAGTACVTIKGVRELRACEYKIPSDRIVAGTYLMCALATGGQIFLKDAPIYEMDSVLKVLRKMGAYIQIKENGIFLSHEKMLLAQQVKTGVYPGFPTDLQSPLLVLLSCAKGEGHIKETIYENRFHIVSELEKMNSKVFVSDNEAVIVGPEKLTGASVIAKELRGNAALVMAGLVACGETEIRNSSYIKRGYENICRDLKSLGAILDEKEDE